MECDNNFRLFIHFLITFYSVLFHQLVENFNSQEKKNAIRAKSNWQPCQPDLPQEAGAGMRGVITKRRRLCLPASTPQPVFAITEQRSLGGHTFLSLGENVRSKVERAGAIPKVYIIIANTGTYRMCLQPQMAIFNWFRVNEQQNKQRIDQQ